MPRLQYPTIDPVPSGQQRPFWSVMIPTYNRTTYLERTLRSVLDQAPDEGEMQIEVVDNASTNTAVEALVREVGGERVKFFRQAENIGMARNWTTCVQRAQGRWVHILHDDDMVRPGFYAAYRSFIEAHSSVGMVLCRPITIDENDEWMHILHAPGQNHSAVWQDGLRRLIGENTSVFLRCPSVVVARQVYETVGGFDPTAFYTCDLQMWIRAAARTDVGYIHQPLTLYREHQQSATFALVRDRDVLADMERTIAIGLALLPAELRVQARQGADHTMAHIAEHYRWHLHRHGHHRAALKYTRHLYRHARSRRNLLLVFKSWLRAAVPLTALATDAAG